MYSKLEEVFLELEAEKGTPFSRQGSYEADEELPNSFYTFFNTNSEYNGYYGNKPSRCDWTWIVFYYTNDPATIYSGMEDFLNKAKEHGFVVKGRGKDIASGEPNYYGRMATIEFIEHFETK